MATDIDKLREVAEKLYMWFSGAQAYWPDASPNLQAGWMHRAEQLVGPFSAELVGLRTEVDQLRGDNAELQRRYDDLAEQYSMYVEGGGL